MMSRNASPSDALANGALNNLRRIQLGGNTKPVADGVFLCHRFQQFTRLYGVKAISAAGNGFTTQLAVTKNGNSILKNEGLINDATAIAADDVVALNFLDGNADGYVDFNAGDLLEVVVSNTEGATVAAADRLCIDLDLVQG